MVIYYFVFIFCSLVCWLVFLLFLPRFVPVSHILEQMYMRKIWLETDLTGYFHHKCDYIDIAGYGIKTIDHTWIRAIKFHITVCSAIGLCLHRLDDWYCSDLYYFGSFWRMCVCVCNIFNVCIVCWLVVYPVKYRACGFH